MTSTKIELSNERIDNKIFTSGSYSVGSSHPSSSDITFEFNRIMVISNEIFVYKIYATL